MNRKLITALALLISTSALSAEEKSCGSAQVIAGSDCEHLFVKFDFTGCAESDKTTPTLQCNGKVGTATVTTQTHTYVAGLEQTDTGTWKISGPLKESSKAVDKADPKPVANQDVKKTKKPKTKPILSDRDLPVHPKEDPPPKPTTTAPPLPVAVAPTPSPSPSPAPTPASPLSNLGNNLVVKGQLRLRPQEDDHTDLTSLRDYTLLRARLDVNYKVNSDVNVFAEPQFAKALGDKKLNTSTTTTNTLVETSGSTNDSSIDMHQVYVDYHPVAGINLYVGRQVLIYGDELLVGASDWNNIGKTFDAFKARWTYSWGWLDGFSSKLADNNTTNTAASSVAGDKELSGIYSSMQFDYIKFLDLYYFQKHDMSTATESRLNAWGLRSKSSIDFFDYRVEYTNETNGLTNAWQYDAELGFTYDKGKLRLGLETLSASEDFDQLYATAHKWLGYADVLGRKNITSDVVHLSSEITKEWLATLDYHWFMRKNSLNPVYKLDGATAIGSGTGSTSNDVGNEIDAQVRWTVDPTTSFTLGAARFFMGQYLKTQFQSTDMGSYYLIMDVKF